MRAAITLLAAAALASSTTLAAPAPQEEDHVVLLRNGTIHTMAGEVVEKGSVLLRNGRIMAVGRDVPLPDGAEVIDCRGGTVVPGFINAGTRVGLVDISLVKSVNDTDAGTDPSTPDIDVRDGVNIESDLWAVTRSRGVTTVLVIPQETNVIAGRSALMHCVDGPEGSVEERTVLAPTGLHVNFGVPPKRRFGGKNRTPSTRMGIAAVVRREFEKARGYVEKRRAWERKKEEGDSKAKEPESDPAKDVLAAALRREIPVFARAHRLDDIRTALRIAEEFRLKLILQGATESWKMADELAKKNIPVVLGPVLQQPSSSETPGARMDAARILHEAGVSFCFMSGDAHNARNLPYHAGIAVSHGLDRGVALAAITKNAAEILGVQDTLGTLQTGREGTLLVFDGDPLEPLSRLRHVLIRGRSVSLRSRQTELYDEWKDR
ncbi:MAG: amidohydrolase family protein [Planctomycetota bacterium]|jgi:imidazolonepropionase-like amidohydrolase